MKKFLFVFLCIFLCLSCAVKRIGNVRVVNVTDNYVDGSIDLTKATVVYDKNDWKVVNNSVRLFVSDVMKVTGDTLTAQESLPSGGDIVLIGSIGKSKWIDKLIEEKKLNVSMIKGGWERFIITVIDRPFEGVGKALVITGSDRRGTAYGVFTVSEAIGVSPWNW